MLREEVGNVAGQTIVVEAQIVEEEVRFTTRWGLAALGVHGGKGVV